jgi:TDG/mug DNA glycosylase family protein
MATPRRDEPALVQEPGGPGGLTMRSKPLPDVVAPDLDVLFCGINPSLVSAARGHHFARPGNRFWPALHLAGLTPRQLAPEEDRQLLDHGLGVTNVVDRPTRSAAELSPAELREGAELLADLVSEYRPRVLAVLGITAWRVGFDRPRAAIGLQPETVGGAATWVVPNPSGLNAHFQLPDLARLYRQLRPPREDVGPDPTSGSGGGRPPSG